MFFYFFLVLKKVSVFKKKKFPNAPTVRITVATATLTGRKIGKKKQKTRQAICAHL